jgi:hypothetical protein
MRYAIIWFSLAGSLLIAFCRLAARPYACPSDVGFWQALLRHSNEL